MSVSQEIIETIKRRIPISVLVSRYIPVTEKSGKKWVVCPFHDDRNPSMLLNDERGSFYCFGCQNKGSIFDFLMLYEHLTFYQALERLAAECGITLRPETEQDKRERSVAERLRDLHMILAAEFAYQLTERNRFAENALGYLRSRMIADDIQKRFMVGYSPPDSSFVMNFLKKRGFSQEEVLSAGLFSAEKKRSYFVGRLMFPIMDAHGKPIAFSGRRMGDESNAPKYINSSETAIFHKGETLFGLYQAKASAKGRSPCIIVEGNFDVLSLHALGYCGAVAACGTALTPEHADLIKRNSDRAVIFFDSDDAGLKAAAKAIITMHSKGVVCSVARLKGFKDASEALAAGDEGKRALEFALGKGAMSSEQFLFEHYSSGRDPDSMSFKSDVISDFTKFASLLGHVDRYELCVFLSERLRLPEKLVEESVFENASRMEQAQSVEPPQSKGLVSEPGARSVSIPNLTPGADNRPLYETDMMRMLAVRREHFHDKAMSFISSADLVNPNNRIIFLRLFDNPYLLEPDDVFIMSIGEENERKYIRRVIEEFAPIYRRYDDAVVSRIVENGVRRIIGARLKREGRGLRALSRADMADQVLLEKSRNFSMSWELNRSIVAENTNREERV